MLMQVEDDGQSVCDKCGEHDVRFLLCETTRGEYGLDFKREFLCGGCLPDAQDDTGRTVPFKMDIDQDGRAYRKYRTQCAALKIRA